MIDQNQPRPAEPAPKATSKTVCIASQSDGSFSVYLEGADESAEQPQPAADIDAALAQARTLLGGAPADEQGAPQGDAEVDAMFGGFNKARGVPLNRG